MGFQRGAWPRQERSMRRPSGQPAQSQCHRPCSMTWGPLRLSNPLLTTPCLSARLPNGEAIFSMPVHLASLFKDAVQKAPGENRGGCWRRVKMFSRHWSLDIIGIACLTHLGSRSHPLLSGQRPDLYQPRATPWVCVWFYPPAGQRPASYVPSVPIGLNPDAASERGWIHRDYESRLQRSKWPLADKPRALPWAGMNDAFGVSDRPAGPPGCCLSGNCGPAPRRRADVMARKCPNSRDGLKC